MTDFAALASDYLAAWNETDTGTRRQVIERVFAPEARYVDPLAVAEGHDALDATIAAVQGQFPGWRFTLAGPVDAHHDQARFTWTLGPDGAPAPVVGFDVVQCDPSGRLVLVLGFLDRVPAAAA